MAETLKGPYIVWQNYGTDGWSPTEFSTLKEALMATKYVSFVVTKLVEFDVIELDKHLSQSSSCSPNSAN